MPEMTQRWSQSCTDHIFGIWDHLSKVTLSAYRGITGPLASQLQYQLTVTGYSISVFENNYHPMAPLHLLPGNQSGLGKTILPSVSVGSTDQIRNLWEGKGPWTRMGFTGKTHCTQVFQNSYWRSARTIFSSWDLLRAFRCSCDSRDASSPGVLPAQRVSIQIGSNDSHAAQHVRRAQWAGPVREQGWDSAFGVPSASRHVLHMHTEMSAAAVCRCGLSQQFLEQHSHLGLHLLWKGLQQCWAS